MFFKVAVDYEGAEPVNLAQTKIDFKKDDKKKSAKVSKKVPKGLKPPPKPSGNPVLESAIKVVRDRVGSNTDWTKITIRKVTA